MQDSPQAAPLQASNLETQPGAGAAAANQGSVPAGGRAEVGAPNLASSGLEFDSARIRAGSAELTGRLGTLANHQAGRGVNHNSAVHPRPDRFSDTSGRDAEACGPDRRPASGQAGRGANCNSAAHPRFDRFSASRPRTPKPAARGRLASGQAGQGRHLRPRRPLLLRPIQRLLWLETPQPAARRPPRKCSSRIRRQLRPRRPLPPRPIRRRLRLRRRSRTPRRQRHVSNESARAIDAEDRFKEEAARENGAAKASWKTRNPQSNQSPGLSGDRLSRRRRKKRRDRHSPRKAPAIRLRLAPVTAPSVQQRFADGMTHAFGYLMHLPGALVPHLGGSNADAHQE